jgi:hypothetical protein
MSPQWTPYADAISEQIETAYQEWVASAAAAEGRDGQDPPRVSIFPRRQGPEQLGPKCACLPACLSACLICPPFYVAVVHSPRHHDLTVRMPYSVTMSGWSRAR